MAKPRVTATDRLANVIEVVELGQRTGLLAVERGSGSVLEEGELYFIFGRVIYASLAGLRGREALAALSRWGPCRFAFDREAPRPAPNISGMTPVPDSRPAGWPSSRPDMSRVPTGYGTPRSPATSGFWPSQGGYEQGGQGTNGVTGYDTGVLGSGLSGVFPRSNAAPGGNGTGGYATGYPPTPVPGPATGYLTPQRPGVAHVPQPGSPLYRRPRRAPDVRDLMSVVTSYGLSRNHRTILLLADGEHTVLDLVRLSSKTESEVTTLLAELEARGLVYYYS